METDSEDSDSEEENTLKEENSKCTPLKRKRSKGNGSHNRKLWTEYVTFITVII